MKQIGMDKKIEKKQWSQKKLYSIAGAVLFILLSFFGLKTLNKKYIKLTAPRFL